MKLCVAGLGKLGAPLAAVLASKGHDVTGIDRNTAAIAAINDGRAPVQEPELQARIDAARQRLRATSDWREAVADSDASFVIVPTPSDANGVFTSEHVIEAVRSIGAALKGSPRYHVVCITSTVMPGETGGAIRAALEDSSGLKAGETVGLCYNPEFIALGSVVRDILRPDMVLLGESDKRAGEVVEKISHSITENAAPVMRMNLVNAEITKLALNSYVTMKISFANLIAELCEQVPGGDAPTVTNALGRDSRIGGKYLAAALGYGGPCFPRDNLALSQWAAGLGVGAELAAATDAINRRQAGRAAALAQRHLPKGGKVAVLGLAYKPHTPVVEESQGVMIAAQLAAAGAQVAVHDPLALANARAALGNSVRYADTLDDAVANADVIVIATPDPAFRRLDTIAAAAPPVVVDCWRLLPPDHPRLIYLGSGAQ
jgi:UDPglucose 6-dehydrogenase